MPNQLFKSYILGLSVLIILGVLVALLWMDLRFIQDEISRMQAERNLLALRILEIKKESAHLEKILGKTLIEAGILSRALSPKITDIRIVKATAYSSTPDQTDESPFITASGTLVRDGVVASNFLPFYTKIRLPEAFGDKIFTVEDRMKRNDLVDVWFKTREEALAFGVRKLKMEILSN